jgi:peptidylprolyl isomerase
MTARQALSSAVLLLFIVSGCGSAASPSDRPGDGLLGDPDLQRIVDLQTARDGTAILEYLDDGDPAVRARAAFALASVQHPGAERLLAPLLDDRDPRVRADAVFAIGQCEVDSSYAESNLLERFASERTRIVRRRYLETFGKIGNRMVLETLVGADLERALLPDLALSIARFGMRGIHDREAVGFLAGSLGSADPLLRRNAAYYFGRMAGTDSWRHAAAEVRDALDQYDRADEAAMQLLLGLGRLEEAADADRFTRWLREGADWRIRANAARAIGGLAARHDVRIALLDGLDDPCVHVAVNCAGSLAQAGELTRTELDRIEAWIDFHGDVWQTAVALLPVLAAAGEGEYVMGWIESLPRERSLPRSGGVAALATIPGDRVFDYLAEMSRSDDARVAAAAVGALARRWRRERLRGADPRTYYPIFSRALEGRDLAAAFTAAPALADSLFEQLGSVDLLISTWQRMEVPGEVEPMSAILSALGRIGGAHVERFLRDVVEEPQHPVLGRGAAEALAAMGVEPAANPVADTAPRPAEIDWEYLATKGAAPRLHLETERGAVIVRLMTEEAPLTVQTILRFTEEGAYDGVAFHRVVPNFVIQGGDFEREDGMGGPGFVIRSEFTRIAYERGVIGMASAGKDTEGSQFFITHSMQPHLDGRYTAFGHVVTGMDVVDSIVEGDRVIRAVIHH